MQLSHRQRDGRQLRAHLLAAQRNGGHTHPLLITQPLPPGGGLLWDALTQLSATRQQGMGGAGGIGFAEIESWQRLHGVQLTPWEVDTLIAMDAASRNAAAKQIDAERKSRKTKSKRGSDE